MASNKHTTQLVALAHTPYLHLDSEDPRIQAITPILEGLEKRGDSHIYKRHDRLAPALENPSTSILSTLNHLKYSLEMVQQISDAIFAHNAYFNPDARSLSSRGAVLDDDIYEKAWDTICESSVGLYFHEFYYDMYNIDDKLSILLDSLDNMEGDPLLSHYSRPMPYGADNPLPADEPEMANYRKSERIRPIRALHHNLADIAYEGKLLKHIHQTPQLISVNTDLLKLEDAISKTRVHFVDTLAQCDIAPDQVEQLDRQSFDMLNVLELFSTQARMQLQQLTRQLDPLGAYEASARGQH